MDASIIFIADLVRGMETMATNERESAPYVNRHEDADKYWDERYNIIREELTELVRERDL